MQQKQTGRILKELYLRKFFSANKPRSTLEKVICFQQKIQDFKISKTSSINPMIGPNTMLEEQTNHLRPSTNHSSYNYRRERHSFNHDNRKIQGPAISELRLILQKRDPADHNVLFSRSNKSPKTSQGYRNRDKFLSYREKSRQQNYEGEYHFQKINMTRFLRDKSISSSQKKTRPLLYHKKQHTNAKQNQLEDEQNIKTPSKKVIIGGRDLEKAAEEYFKHYKQTTKKIENAEAIKHQKMIPVSERRLTSRNRLVQKNYKKQKVIIPNQKLKGSANSRTEAKIPKYQDLIINLDLDPWNVDADYY